MSAIGLDHVCFAHKGAARMHFNFEVEAGERLAVMGASGAGKSTLLHLLAGFETPNSGRITYGNLDMSRAEPALRPVSIIFQDNNLFGHLTVEQNIGLGLAPRLRLSRAEISAVHTAMAKVGLEGKAKRLPSELSGGERQRAALARALLRDKPVLLLDEPFAALGPAMRTGMLDLLLQLQAEKNLTMIMVTHTFEDAARFATRFGFMEAGALTSLMPAFMLRHPEQGSAVAAYLGTHSSSISTSDSTSGLPGI